MILTPTSHLEGALASLVSQLSKYRESRGALGRDEWGYMKSEQHSLKLIMLTSITNYSNFYADSVGNWLQNSLGKESVKQVYFAMCVLVKVCEFRHTHAHVRKSEENFQKSLGSFYPAIRKWIKADMVTTAFTHCSIPRVWEPTLENDVYWIIAKI